MESRWRGLMRKYDYWFPERRLGMFIHWGLYAIPAWHEQIRGRLNIPRKEYGELATKFNPVNFSPDEWIDLAESAGMKYICFTTKHHDGFCMWATKYTDFNIMNTPYNKDVLDILAERCHARDIGLSLYYSNPDWNHPNAYNPLSTHQLKPYPDDEPNQAKYLKYVKNQVEELCSNYGKIISFFWDIPPRIYMPSINDRIRELQPGIMINDRGYDEGDYSTPEREIPSGKRFIKPTEACQSVGSQSWGYRKNEDYFTSKYLMASIDKILAMGGNYLLNVGPKADGSIPSEAKKILEEIGNWYHRVKESFEGTEPASELMQRDDLLLTRCNNTLYVHLPDDLTSTGITLNPVSVLPVHGEILNTGEKLNMSLDIMPELCHVGGQSREYLHISNIDVNHLIEEVVILKLVFDDLEEAFNIEVE
jgi:alpha-L-fucosidase